MSLSNAFGATSELRHTIENMDQELSTRVAFPKEGDSKGIYRNEWWFSVVDVIEALTGTDRPGKYWSDLKKKLAKEGVLKCPKKSDS